MASKNRVPDLDLEMMRGHCNIFRRIQIHFESRRTRSVHGHIEKVNLEEICLPTTWSYQ